MQEKLANFITEWVYPRATFLICSALAVVSVLATVITITSTPATGETVIEITGAKAEANIYEPDTNADIVASDYGADIGPIVHIVGAVKEPGLIQAPLAARVFDVIELAGGLSDDADQTALNLARFVNDGEQIYVPKIGEQGEQNNSVITGVGPQKININRATAADLETLPRIGPSTAAKIIAWRNANGSFTDLQQLTNIAGIGQKTLDGIIDFISI